jgi:hypothetical protein
LTYFTNIASNMALQQAYAAEIKAKKAAAAAAAAK